jgi:hypothetical protein
MRLVTDEMVPDSIGEFLAARRHKVLRVREHLKLGTPDDGVARFANQSDAIILTWNVRDFARLLNRKLHRQFPKAGLISFNCEEADGRTRLEQFIVVIEAEFAHLQTRPDKRLFVDIAAGHLRIWR